jgi:hypothetical protein
MKANDRRIRKLETAHRAIIRAHVEQATVLQARLITKEEAQLVYDRLINTPHNVAESSIWRFSNPIEAMQQYFQFINS